MCVCVCVCVCTFQPGNFTGWGSEGVMVIPRSKAVGIIMVDFNYKRDLDLGHDHMELIL